MSANSKRATALWLQIKSHRNCQEEEAKESARIELSTSRERKRERGKCGTRRQANHKWIAIYLLINNICLSNIKKCRQNATHDNRLKRLSPSPSSSLYISPSYLPILSLCLSLKSQLCRSFCFKSRLVTTFLFIYFDFDFDWISAKEANGRICLPARSHSASAGTSHSPSRSLWLTLVSCCWFSAFTRPICP